MPEIQISAISKTFVDPAGRAFQALKNIDLQIHSGESFSLLGPSGCGKSTLLRILSGLETPDSGRVLFDGNDVTALPPEKRPTAMVFQSYALFPHLTVEGNIAFGLRIRKQSRAESRRKVDEMLDLVQLSGLHKRKMSELSGGQQQRVALARVLAIEPSILLMDEPLSNLDASLRRGTRSTIRRIQTELGLTLVYVTHDQEEAMMISDRIALMDSGSILQSGTPREIYDAPASARAAIFFGQRNMIPCWARGSENQRVGLALSQNGNATLPIGPIQPIGPIGIPGRDGLVPAWLAVKPDEILLAKPGDSENNPSLGWPAEVVLVSFAGAAVEVEVRLKETGQMVRALQPRTAAGSASGIDPATAIRHGDRVTVGVKPGAAILYPRDPERADP